MKKHRTILICGVVLTLSLLAGFFVWKSVYQTAQNVSAAAHPKRFTTDTVVIDAGHGGEDGGAVSLNGSVESQINLAIALRLDEILGLYGADVKMLRTEDTALYDAGMQTLREKKVSDLHNRVEEIESIPHATLISIHQNTYPSTKFHGAQVFYSNERLSVPLAQFTQETLRTALDPSNNRKAAKIPDSVYLMNHISCRAILVECGFLSNPAEDALLSTEAYQTKIAAALGAAYLGFTQEEMIS